MGNYSDMVAAEEYMETGIWQELANKSERIKELEEALEQAAKIVEGAFIEKAAVIRVAEQIRMLKNPGEMENYK